MAGSHLILKGLHMKITLRQLLVKYSLYKAMHFLRKHCMKVLSWYQLDVNIYVLWPVGVSLYEIFHTLL